MSLEYDNLITSLIKDGYLKTPEIIEAFKQIDRADFVPEKHKLEAYVNAPLPINFGQTISQPLTVAFMLELLEPRPAEKILDVGFGSGWTSTLLAQMVGEQGKIIAVERISELYEFGANNIAKYNFIEKGIVRTINADGTKGYKKEAPYDKIIAGAAAYGDIPLNWKRQLKIGGRIVAPVENSIIVIDKVAKNRYDKKEYFGFSFVPLVKNGKIP